MYQENKVKIILVTRNNNLLLQNFIQSIEKNDAGYSYDLTIADNTSTDKKHLDYLDKICRKYHIISCENDRVEVTFDYVVKKFIDEYPYFLFLHDDTFAFKNDWLKVIVDKINSKYCEKIITNTHYSGYPIGRVCLSHQPYRDFETCLGYPVQSIFLREALKVLKKNLLIYKYGDSDRCLWTQSCLKKCNGLWNIKKFKDIEGTQQFKDLSDKLNECLQYADEGMSPKEKYPIGQTWNKFTLLSEFLNSVWPLIEGFRTVGLEGDGFLEEVDGFDIPWGNDYLFHYGQPNCKKWLAKHFKDTPENIHKKIYSNDLVFLTKCNNLIKPYFKE